MVFITILLGLMPSFLMVGFGADRALVATRVAQSTLLAALSLPLWIMAIRLAF